MLPMDIDKLTDEQLDALIGSVELRCKIDPKTSIVTCPTTEDISRAIARLKNPVKRLVFDIEPEPEPEPVPEPVTESAPEPVPEPTES